MPTIRELTEPFLSIYTFVPSSAPGVCRVCHGPVDAVYDTCFSCYQTRSQVEYPTDRVVPISLCENLGHLHYMMRMYKDGRTEDVQREFRLRVAATLARFLQLHRTCIGDWNLLTTIPTGRNRPGEHPLAQAIRLVPNLNNDFIPLLSPGTSPPAHNAASDNAYEVTEDVEGLNVLIVDDTFTSGAAAQSAASAVRRARADVTAVVPVARYIKPAFSDLHQAFWDSAREQDFSFDRCCLE